ncbi:MAG: hypothetical protein HY660_15010 [Armatimonadetes bacterium]|nr:hypothetical protein [Armatimonadota bacterium]
MEIVDVDAPGAGDDRIWSGNTDNNGSFGGESSEWQDVKTIKVKETIRNPLWPYNSFDIEVEKTITDVSDVLSLVAHVVQDTAQGRKETTLPFAFVSDATPSPPVVVPWGPPQPPVVGKVNGEECRSDVEIHTKVVAAVDAGRRPITMEIYGPSVAVFEPLTRTQAQLREWVQRKLGIFGRTDLMGNRAVAEISVGQLLAIAVIILCIGAAIFTVLVGLAILYAIYKGYTPIRAQQRTNATTGETYLEVTMGA